MAGLNGYLFYLNNYSNNLKLKKMKTQLQTLSYYIYSTPKVSVIWHNKVQPMGYFKSANEAINALINQGAILKDYALNCDGTILKLSEYL